MKKLELGILLVVMILFGAACDKTSDDNNAATQFIPGPMAQCVAPGNAMAGVITDLSETLVGLNPDPAVGEGEKTALGAIGDIKLMNNKAAFIIQRTDWRDSYFSFGGNLLDAVAIQNCQQAGPEQFQELQMLVGKLDIANLTSSFLRAVRAESIQIVSDGSAGGPAIVRVHGTEDIFYTVELNLMFLILTLGEEYIGPPPFNFDVTIDYILQPDSHVLQIEMTVRNTQSTSVDILDGVAMFFGDTTPVQFPYAEVIGVQGFGVQFGVPWMVASRGDGAWAVAMPNANMGGVNISGLTAALDTNLVPIGGGAPIPLDPAGGAADSHTFTRYFSVGPTDQDSGIEELYPLLQPNVLPGLTLIPEHLQGEAYDLFTGNPLEGAAVTVQSQNGDGDWVFIDGFVTGADGKFSGNYANYTGFPYRAVASVSGKLSPAPVDLTPGVTSTVAFAFMPGGNFSYEVRDAAGQLLPAKIILWQGGQLMYRFHTGTGTGVENVAPGIYDVSVTRGTEYSTYQTTASVPGNNTYYLNATLTHTVDTSGYLSVDGHIHSGRSPDNYISVEERVITCAAEGLEIPVATDHEFAGGWQWAVNKLALNKWVHNIAGEEVTAPLPGHTNIYPIPDRFDINARGGYVRWDVGTPAGWPMDIAQIFAAERARGAGIVQVNHPRDGVFFSVNWNPVTGQPDLQSPATIGLPPTASLWSWNFDAMELQNGNQNPFKNTTGSDMDARRSGTFEDWMSFLNMGHRVTAMGNSDAHNYEMPGYPRNFFKSPTDSTLNFTESYLVQSILAGRVVVSTGAFARVKVNGTADMGDTITDTDGSVDLWVHIEAIPEIDVTYFKVFVNCDEVNFGGSGFVNTTDPNGVVKYDGIVQVPIIKDSHIVVMGFGANKLPLGLHQFSPKSVPRFTTNAIYIDFDDNGAYDPPGPKACSYGIPEL